jgi:two-component system response regulator FixJ
MDDIAVHLVGIWGESSEHLIECLRMREWTTKHYESVPEFEARYSPAASECLVLSLNLPGERAFQMQRSLLQKHWMLPVIATSLTPVPNSIIVEAMRLGAIDILELPCSEDEIVRKVSGALEVDGSLKQRRDARARKLATLSDREHQVLELLLEAATVQQIANRLGISPKTVEKHRANIMQKTDVGSVPELMRLMFLDPQPLMALRDSLQAEALQYT